MKKTFIFLIFLCLCMSAACGKESSGEQKSLSADEQPAVETVTPSPTPTEAPTATPVPTLTPTPSPSPSPTELPNMPDIPQRGITKDVPEEYLLPAENGGTVERISYPSRNYAGEAEDILKIANVYLPAGYDPDDTETRYDIFYFMHGWTGNADEFFSFGDGMVKNLFDHMIGNGDIPPMIIVAATFDSLNESADFEWSVEEVEAFHDDFARDLMPAVEARYHSYALSVSGEDLVASRDHRAFGGFSLGSVTTWLEFCYDAEYMRYFLPISAACWYYGAIDDPQPVQNTDLILSVIGEKKLNDKGYFIYACTGTEDSMRGELDLQMEEMFSRPAAFTPEHVVYYYNEGAAHELVALPEYLYNALPVFFGK